MNDFKYNQVYDYLKKQITDNQLQSGARLPSVRKAAELFSVSRTTVQNAYFELAADGYIFSEPQSGYYVSYRGTDRGIKDETKAPKKNIKYDFTSSSADAQSFDFNLWRRYMKNALKQDERLLSYSETQGELELREAIAEYIFEKRNVVTSPDRIVVGAGVQSLLSVFCALIDDKGTVSFPDKSFEQGASLFNDYGFEVNYRYKDADIVYVSPSHMTLWGDVMPNRRRRELVRHSAEINSLVIEDDYESDFSYNARPTPSLHALAGGRNVVYLGSFSRLLLPSIRISFMVLTQELAEKYRQNIYKFSQTASKAEQLALCAFIRDGHLKGQIRKTRRLYTTKTKDFAMLLAKKLPDAEIEISENALHIIIKTRFDKDICAFEDNECAVFIDSCKDGIINIVISVTSISEKDFENAANLLKKALR